MRQNRKRIWRRLLPGSITLTATLSGAYRENAGSDDVRTWDNSGKTITFTGLPGSPTAVTDASGVATCTLTDPAPGTYNIGASFAGDNNNRAASATTTSGYTVLPAPSGGATVPRDDDPPSPTEVAVSKIDKAKEGDAVELDLSGSGKLPGRVLEQAAGRDVTLEISAGKGMTWIINGLDIQTAVGHHDENGQQDGFTRPLPIFLHPNPGNVEMNLAKWRIIW